MKKKNEKKEKYLEWNERTDEWIINEWIYEFMNQWMKCINEWF